MIKQKPAAAIVLSIAMLACTSPESIPVSQNTPAPAETLATVTEESPDDETVNHLLNVLSQIMNETYGADIDFSKPALTDELASYYSVSNYKSADEIINDLRSSCSDEVIDRVMIENDFTVKDGEFYAVRGGRGYGYYGINPDQWKRADDTSVTVQFTLMGDPVKDEVVTVTFASTDRGWIIDHYNLPEGYTAS